MFFKFPLNSLFYALTYFKKGKKKMEEGNKKKKRRKAFHAVIVAIALMVAMAACSILGAATYAKLTEEDTSPDSEAESEIAQTSSILLTDVSDIVEEAMPSVVSITSRTLVMSGGYGSMWGFKYGQQEQTTEEVESGIGSGTIVGENDTELLILTSYHVVEDCSSLYITFCDDENVEGYIKNADESTDIAIVAVLLSDIPDSTYTQIAAIEMSTDEIEVGEGVIVIGDALGYGQSVVTGIISATSREITVDDSTISVLQTDAAINSGNSGGCVLNSDGKIIGISEAKISSSSVEGMCYAIPIAENYDLIMSLMQ